MSLPDITLESLARSVLSLAEDAGMPSSFWYTDSRIQLACRVLGVSPDSAYTTDWHGDASEPNNVPIEAPADPPAEA